MKTRRTAATLIAALSVLATTALAAPTQASPLNAELPTSPTITTATKGIGHDYEPLRDAAARKGKTFGFAYAPHIAAQDSQYKAIAQREFSMVTAENNMKWDATEPRRGQFTFNGADEIMSFAKANNQKVYGHALVWHSQMPNWAKQITSRDDMRRAMNDHIKAVAGRYKGQIEAWDVVNEAFEWNGTRRQSELQKVMGDYWIEEAFRTARAADPNAKLCYNDYSTDGINAKSDAIYRMVKDFKSRGVPIDCVGFQTHLIVGELPATNKQNLQRFADLGVDVRITELDIRIKLPASQQDINTQAREYGQVVENCFGISRCTGVTIWGITDKYSWIPQVSPGWNASLPWNENYTTKPALASVAQAMGAKSASGGDNGGTPGLTCGISAKVGANWGNGYTMDIVVANKGTTPITDWTFATTLPQGQKLSTGWSGTYSQNGQRLTVTPGTWNRTIAPGQSVSFNFNVAKNGNGSTALSNFTINGQHCP